jgi:hypothetical protein
MEDSSTYRCGLTIADLAYAYAALVEDCERVVDESGGPEVTLRRLPG